MTPEPVKLAAHASESGHWYSRTGELVETVEGKVPDFRNKLVRKYDLAPGVTSVMRMKSQPSLLRWMQQEAIRCALTLPRKRCVVCDGAGEVPNLVENPNPKVLECSACQGTGLEPEQEWLDRILDDSKETARSAADEGTRIHAAIEQHYRRETCDPAYERHVTTVRELLDNIAPGEQWLPEGGVISPLGVGSKIDILGERFGVDLKGTEKPVDQLRTYDTHWMQTGFYDHVRPGRRWLIVYVHRVEAWAHAIEVTRQQLDRGFAAVRCCTKLWQIEKSYRPSWASMEP